MPANPYLLYIESLDKMYYVPLKCNRLVDDSQESKPYQRIDTLHWTDAEQHSGKRVKLHKFPRDHQGESFPGSVTPGARIGVDDQRLESIRCFCYTTGCVAGAGRLNIDVTVIAKQLTGLENCQCRLPRIVSQSHRLCVFCLRIYLRRIQSYV